MIDEYLIKYRFSVCVVIVSIFMILSLGVGITSAQQDSADVPTDIQQIIDQDQVNEEQRDRVQEWFYNTENIDSSNRDEVGIWLRNVTVSSDMTVDTPESVVVNINDNITLRDYNFNRDEGTVTLILHASDRSEQIVLTDPQSSESTGVGDVNQRGITVPRSETVSVDFSVGYSAYTGSSTVWISAGAGETRYVSNSEEELLDRIEAIMLPIASLGTTFAIFLSGLIYIWKTKKRLKDDYTNVFRKLR